MPSGTEACFQTNRWMRTVNEEHTDVEVEIVTQINVFDSSIKVSAFNVELVFHVEKSII